MARSIFVVILTWNHVTDTIECLDSLIHINYPDLHILVVDNGSTDDTVARIAQDYPDIVIIQNKENLGYAAGNNVGIRYALDEGAEYILLLNNDVIVKSDFLEPMLDTFSENPDAGILSPFVYWYKRPENLWFSSARWDTKTVKFNTNYALGEFENPIETDFASGCAFLIKAEVIKKIGVLEPRFFLMWEETDFCFRARRVGYKILAVPKAKVLHKVSQSFDAGASGPIAQYYYTRNRFLWIERNLRGLDRVKAFLRCFQEIYWLLLEGRMIKLDSAVRYARLQGSKDYFLRRFGKRVIQVEVS